MAILKPNIPLKYVKPDGTTQSEYPLTSIDQVIDEDGVHRLNQTIVRADLSDVEEGQVVLTNSDLLENHPANYFATSEDLNTAITNGTLKIDLLWTNASPTSAFGGQTLSIDTREYKLLLVYFRRFINSDDINETYCFMGKIGDRFVCLLPRGDIHYYNRRLINIDENGLFIGDSLLATDVVDNGALIPYMIYGVR